MNKQKIRITIDKEGNYTFKALEGFAGEQCREQTKQIEMLLGGEAVSSENTKEYYDDADPNLDLNLNI